MMRFRGRARRGHRRGFISMKRWICIYCGFIYDEALGRPDEGIPAGTRWADVPETWECPDCGNPKSAFIMEEI